MRHFLCVLFKSDVQLISIFSLILVFSFLTINRSSALIKVEPLLIVASSHNHILITFKGLQPFYIFLPFLCFSQWKMNGEMKCLKYHISSFSLNHSNHQKKCNKWIKFLSSLLIIIVKLTLIFMWSSQLSWIIIASFLVFFSSSSSIFSEKCSFVDSWWKKSEIKSFKLWPFKVNC